METQGCATCLRRKSYRTDLGPTQSGLSNGQRLNILPSRDYIQKPSFSFTIICYQPQYRIPEGPKVFFRQITGLNRSAKFSGACSGGLRGIVRWRYSGFPAARRFQSITPNEHRTQFDTDIGVRMPRSEYRKPSFRKLIMNTSHSRLSSIIPSNGKRGRIYWITYI